MLILSPIKNMFVLVYMRSLMIEEAQANATPVFVCLCVCLAIPEVKAVHLFLFVVAIGQMSAATVVIGHSPPCIRQQPSWSFACLVLICYNLLSRSNCFSGTPNFATALILDKYA